MATNYVITARTTTSTTGDNRLTGLSPAWSLLKRLSDGADVSPRPTIVEVGQGQYMFSYDAANGEASGQIDLGATVPNPNDRYIDVILAADSELIAANLDAPVSGVAASVNTVALDAGVVAASPAPTTTVFGASGADLNAFTGAYAGMSVLFTSGANAGVKRTIQGHTYAAGLHTFTLSSALPVEPSTDDAFVIG